MNEYPSLRIEGGLISAEVLADIREEKTPGQRGGDFGEKDLKLLDMVSAAWGDAQGRWIIFQRQVGRLGEGDPATTPTRAWMSDLLSLLGFDLVRLQSLIEQDGKKYHISHRAGTDPNAPPVHIVGSRQSIDRRPESGPSLMAPHSMVQDFLNHSDELWGIVTNGMVLRLLRDSHLMKRQAYIEFDLEEIFTGDRFPDFYLLFRLVHASRFPKGVSDIESCLLEQYHRLSIEQGGRVREGLRTGVEQALLLLANGFLSHPKNTEFAAEAASGKIDPSELYRQLLKIIYRFLFLMVCEERGLVSSDPVYKQYYSINRIRKLIQNRGSYTRHTDLWTGLVTQFTLFSDEELGGVIGVPPLNGELFAEQGTSLINDLQITNDALLNAVWNLAMYQEITKKGKTDIKGPWRRVNYGSLDVEELGSVYESLLDLQPHFLPTISGDVEYRFFAGTERKSTGSHYTPPELVNELIQTALVPVINEQLSETKNQKDKEEALLSLSVCDPAAGSGHFLLAAARRIGRELAKIRSGDEEPSPEATRDAIRDVIT
ncbi:MAG: N-6 DNA methylase, partial [Methanobacteriota archaeon]